MQREAFPPLHLHRAIRRPAHAFVEGASPYVPLQHPQHGGPVFERPECLQRAIVQLPLDMFIPVTSIVSPETTTVPWVQVVVVKPGAVPVVDGTDHPEGIAMVTPPSVIEFAAVYVNDRQYGEGDGPSKKQAEQSAAWVAWTRLQDEAEGQGGGDAGAT